MLPVIEPAAEQSHEFVLDRETGAWISLGEFVGAGDYGAVVAEKRVALQVDQARDVDARYVCPHCEVPLLLKSLRIRDRSVQRFFFDHARPSPGCGGTRGLTKAQICALRFGHSKEGAQHRKLKRWVEQSLLADPSFADIDVERRWVDNDGTRWRQPDVQATWNFERVAFEVQLSTTFLHVIGERLAFYGRNQGRLLWLFRDLDVGRFKLSEDDLFFANNRNAFRVTAETVGRSESARKFFLECTWMVPALEGSQAIDTQHRAVIAFDEISFDIDRRGIPRAYYFDYESAAAAVRQAADSLREENRLRDAVEDLVVRSSLESMETVERQWRELALQLRDHGLPAPLKFYGPHELCYVLSAAYSAKRGQVVGSGQKNFASLANTLFARHKRVLHTFSTYMSRFKRENEMRAHGDMRKWQEKVRIYRRELLAENPDYARRDEFDTLLGYLIP